jgi:hypothetical protein
MLAVHGLSYKQLRLLFGAGVGGTLTKSGQVADGLVSAGMVDKIFLVYFM